MRPRKTILLVGVLVIWVLMTYLAFMRSVRGTDGLRPRPAFASNKLMLEKVQDFEQNLKSFADSRARTAGCSAGFAFVFACSRIVPVQ